MSDFCRKYPRQTQCEATEIKGDTSGVRCEPFDVCLPFGRSLHFDGYCMSVKGNPEISDGEYGTIIVKDGCIVDAKPAPVFQYTPPPCNESAIGCGGSSSGSGGAAGVVIQTGACNLLKQDASGRLGAFLTVEGGEGVSVTGCGSESNPLVINMETAEAERTHIQSASVQSLVVSGDGGVSNPYMLDLAEVFEGGTYLGFTVDTHGRITGYENVSAGSIIAVVAGPGISVMTEGGTATVSLATVAHGGGTYIFGGYQVKIDLAGRITNIEQAIDLGEDQQTIDPYENQLTISELGSITAITPYVRAAANVGHHHQSAGNGVSDTLLTDREGFIHVQWTGWEPVTDVSVGDAEIGAYTSKATSMFTGTVDEGAIAEAYGRFARRYTTASNGANYVITGIQTGLVEFCFRSSARLGPGTHVCEITKVNGDAFNGISNMVMFCTT